MILKSGATFDLTMGNPIMVEFYTSIRYHSFIRFLVIISVRMYIIIDFLSSLDQVTFLQSAAHFKLSAPR